MDSTLRASRTKRTVYLNEPFNHIRRNRSIPGGSSCSVIDDPNDSGRVIKIYDDSREAVKAHLFQRMFAKWDKAPKIFGLCKVVDTCGDEYLGVISEKVKTISYKVDEYGKKWALFENLKGPIRHHIQDMWDTTKAWGIGDVFEGNIGIKNGRFVFIDFGVHTLSLKKLRNIIYNRRLTKAPAK